MDKNAYDLTIKKKKYLGWESKPEPAAKIVNVLPI